MMCDPNASLAGTDMAGMGYGENLEVDGKEILHFNGFILIPPPPHAPARSTREKPPGCKTVFIGGVPENATEEMLGELMQTCGGVETYTFAQNISHYIGCFSDLLNSVLYEISYFRPFHYFILIVVLLTRDGKFWLRDNYVVCNIGCVYCVF